MQDERNLQCEAEAPLNLETVVIGTNEYVICNLKHITYDISLHLI